MTVSDLKAKLIELGVPDDAEVFVEADYGQDIELADTICVSRWPKTHDYFGDPDAMVWEWDGYEECYDEDALDEYDPGAPITAVLIGY